MTTDLNPLPTRTPPDTGSKAVDAEHGIQLGLIEAARESLENNEEMALAIVRQLQSYTQAHFLSEQLLMRQAAQPDFEGHQQEHELLLQQLDELCSAAESGARGEALARIKEHEHDLLAHIRGWDRNVGKPAS